MAAALARAVARHVRMTPRKIDYVAVPLRQQTVASALAQLASRNRRAARPLAKLIASAFANARQQHPELREDQVVITKLTADQGPSWKRFRAAAFGRAARILKRTTHITVELDRPGARTIAPTAPPAARAAQPAMAMAGATKASSAVRTAKRAGPKPKSTSQQRTHGT